MKFRKHLQSLNCYSKKLTSTKQKVTQKNDPDSCNWERVEWRDDTSETVQSSCSIQASQIHIRKKQNELIPNRSIPKISLLLKTVSCGKRNSAKGSSLDYQMERDEGRSVIGTLSNYFSNYCDNVPMASSEIENIPTADSECIPTILSDIFVTNSPEYECAMRVYAEILRQTSAKSSNPTRRRTLKKRIFESSLANGAIIKNDVNKTKVAQIIFMISTGHIDRNEYHHALPILWTALQICQSIGDKHEEAKHEIEYNQSDT
eukprot:3508526-Ditylum_brightwellii.AAC.1